MQLNITDHGLCDAFPELGGSNNQGCSMHFSLFMRSRFHWSGVTGNRNGLLPPLRLHFIVYHYDDVIMTTIASQITSLTVVYSTVYSDADQSKHQSSASPAFVWGIHRDRWIPRTKGQLRGKCFHLMTSSCQGDNHVMVEDNQKLQRLCKSQ